MSFHCKFCPEDLSLTDQLITHALIKLDTLEIFMTEFANDQAHLDADVQAETDALVSVKLYVVNQQAEIDALKAAHAAGQPLDFTKLDSLAASISAVLPAVPTPAVPTPTPVAAEPTPTPVAAEPAPTAAKPLYTYAGTGAIDPTVWLTAGTASDGRALYTFVNDAAGGPATAASAEWVVYTPTA